MMMKMLSADRKYDANGVPVNVYFLTEHNTRGIALPSKRT